MKYWEIVDDKLDAAGWSRGYCSASRAMVGAGLLTLIATMVAATSFILMNC